MRTVLECRRKFEDKLIFILVKDESGIRVEFATDLVKPDVDRWISRGISELHGEPGFRTPRVTKPEDSEFMFRLAEYVKKLGFRTNLREEIAE